MKIFMYIILLIVIIISLTTIIILNQAKFGKLPTGVRLERIKKSPNYRNGSFQNQSITTVMSEDVNYFSLLKENLFNKDKRLKPTVSLPTIKTDLLHLNKSENILVWFGHSSYFMQIGGKRILVDPVLSSYASPFSFSIQAFEGTSVYAAEDIPEIDYLFITHDHWDHLDYETIVKLKSKIKQVICPLGVGEDFEYWGFDKNIISELDWNEKIKLENEIVVTAVPARHFSGRGFTRNKTLWTAYIFQAADYKVFIGGDGGYDKHFAEIGKHFGPIDLAILENGQYNEKWKYIHMLPNQILQAYNDLNAKKLLAVHSSKFALANHAWDEPLSKIAATCKENKIALITPMIGEKVNLNDSNQLFTEWWKNVE